MHARVFVVRAVVGLEGLFGVRGAAEGRRRCGGGRTPPRSRTPTFKKRLQLRSTERKRDPDRPGRDTQGISRSGRIGGAFRRRELSARNRLRPVRNVPELRFSIAARSGPALSSRRARLGRRRVVIRAVQILATSTANASGAYPAINTCTRPETQGSPDDEIPGDAGTRGTRRRPAAKGRHPADDGRPGLGVWRATQASTIGSPQVAAERHRPPRTPGSSGAGS